MFPSDAITLYVSTTTAGNYPVLVATTSPYTLLYSTIYTSVVGESRLLIGTTTTDRVAFAGSYSDTQHNYVFTNSLVSFSKIGVGTSSLELIYVPRNRTLKPDYASTTPLYIQDSGNISFGFAIVIFTMFLMVVAMVYNNFKAKRSWR
jgi:hypothetical protein